MATCAARAPDVYPHLRILQIRRILRLVVIRHFNDRRVKFPADHVLTDLRIPAAERRIRRFTTHGFSYVPSSAAISFCTCSPASIASQACLIRRGDAELIKPQRAMPSRRIPFDGRSVGVERNPQAIGHRPDAPLVHVGRVDVAGVEILVHVVDVCAIVHLAQARNRASPKPSTRARRSTNTAPPRSPAAGPTPLGSSPSPAGSPFRLDTCSCS